LASVFKTLVVKEVRDLIKDPKILFGMILVPLMMYPVMGLAVNVSTEAVTSSMGGGNIAVMDLDGGNFSKVAIAYFRSIPNLTVNVLAPADIGSAIVSSSNLNATSLVVIPPGFSANATSGNPVTLLTYTPLKTFGVTEEARARLTSQILNSFGSFLTEYYIRTAAPQLNASVVMRPLSVVDSSIVNGKILPISPSSISNMIFTQSFMMPLAVMMVVIIAMQIAATAIAVEKEQKTLEILLTLPVSRFNILASKLLGSTVIAALGAVASVVGLTYYMSSLTKSFGEAANYSLNISPPPTYYVILGGLIFLTLALATSLAMVVAVFAEDVRGAQAVIGYLVFPIILPSLMIMIGDLQSFSPALQVVLLSVPFTYAFAFAKMAFVGDMTIGLVGLGYISLWTIGILYLASRVFSSEKILTAKFSFGRKRKPAMRD
jgi:ABC-2 type transport system permease protein